MRRTSGGRSHRVTAWSVLGAILVAAALASCSSASSSSAPSASDAAPPSPPKTTYYVSLGDSFAVGVQPNLLGQDLPTDQGYADDLYNNVKPSMPGLQLVKLGCSGETTDTAIKGGTCPYEQGSQLAAATAFIQANRSSIAFVTVELGANNFEGCVTNGEVDAACALNQVNVIETELPQIFQQLRSAGGPGLRIVGMNLFDPFLVEWFDGPLGQSLARQSVPAVQDFNESLASTYQQAGAKTADVADAFSTYASFSQTEELAGAGSVPLPVARLCQWTWACAPAPVGPTDHPNAVGYQQIANAFRAQIP